MVESEFHKLLAEYIDFYEQTNHKEIQEDKERLEYSNDIISDFISMFNESIRFHQRERILWLMLRYGTPNNFKLLIEWIHSGLSNTDSIAKLDNLAKSQENIIGFLLENGLLQIPDIQNMISVLKRREIMGYPDRPRKLLEFHLKNIQEEFQPETKSPISLTQGKTKADTLKESLRRYGFFEIEKVRLLSEHSKQLLIELISKNPMPYGIAMFEQLGFDTYLDIEQGAKYKANLILSRLYNGNAKDGTSAKHYRRSLIKPLERYKAGEYKEIVQTDYQKLK